MTKMTIEGYYSGLRKLTKSIAVTDSFGRRLTLRKGVDCALSLIEACRDRGGKLMFVGNGASSSISSHMAADFSKNGGMKAMAFNDPALLTCLSNDCGYDMVFRKPVALFAEKEDILIAISSSGRSQNILNAVKAASEKGCPAITLSGFRAGNPLSRMGEINFYVPSDAYSDVEIMHHSVCHYTLDMFIKRSGRK
jgi:D-sedoheptulose 7-phosphate isomerase